MKVNKNTMDLEKLNRIIGYDKLTLEEKIRRAVRAAKLEMNPVWIDAMRRLPGAKKIEQSAEMWRFARQSLYQQEIRKGKTEAEAWAAVAKRLLAGNDW